MVAKCLWFSTLWLLPMLSCLKTTQKLYLAVWKSESEVAQSCLTLCDPMDCSLPGSSIHTIFQARILGWVAISFSRAWKWKVTVKSLSCVRLSATPWTAAYQAPPSMGFSRQEYWSGVPLPSLLKEVTTLEIYNVLNCHSRMQVK